MTEPSCIKCGVTLHTWAQVGEIRGRIAAKEPFAKIAEDYPVKVSTIMKISQNKQWVINV